jgi:hypothetical protein
MKLMASANEERDWRVGSLLLSETEMAPPRSLEGSEFLPLWVRSTETAYFPDVCVEIFWDANAILSSYYHYSTVKDRQDLPPIISKSPITDPLGAELKLTVKSFNSPPTVRSNAPRAVPIQFSPLKRKGVNIASQEN